MEKCRKFYFAPMEGVTGSLYRKGHHKFFGGIDKYFTPFIVPTQSRRMLPRELNDVLPEHNKGVPVVPQILTNHSEGFIWAAEELRQMGYQEINLNLGCPAGTVVAKQKGSGFLAKVEELDLFLDQIFTHAGPDISIKTRIGKDSPEEFQELMGIFNKYPLKELIIHPRIQQDYYKNKPNLKVFEEGVLACKNPVCYNGDLFTAQDYKNFIKGFPNVNHTMLGRGLVTNPGLILEIEDNMPSDKKTLRLFHDYVYEGYQDLISGDRNVLFKMKELWSYMIWVFSNNSKYAKKIRKSERLADYENAVNSLFLEQEIVPGAGFCQGKP